jgi:small redox-active disulfide protein 2
MKMIKVLGSGCPNCKTTCARIETVAKKKGVAISLEKIEEMDRIMSYGVMSMPVVVIDEKVIHSGSVPDEKNIESWL